MAEMPSLQSMRRPAIALELLKLRSPGIIQASHAVQPAMRGNSRDLLKYACHTTIL